MCVCVIECVLVYGTLWRPNAPTKRVKPQVFQGKKILKILNDVYLKM